MSAGSSSTRTLVVVAAIVILVAIAVSVMKGRDGDSSPETAAVEEAAPGSVATGVTDSETAGAGGQATSPQVATGGRTMKPPANSPDIMFVDFDFTPKTPVRGKPVIVRASVKNSGSKPAPAFNVAWHASADQSVPAHVWSVPKLNPGSRHQLEFEYAGFKRDYAELKTMIVIDPEGVIVDKDHTNNQLIKTITVAKQ